ncbi:hypothetical protein KFL_007310050 [Klebsormidium nitens]|uniref:PiggyBac transposable element-derived protein domain-containing protein n=1 Tax=Klebsormidium nitens TaxID=105231 RepID=A0A1Y1ISH8_KLENI|nr:hypothetical protein KFL_007310050 [Klebsormidium nitens]|eukprot:GAQ91128.1 hypothetical protein KFL_007310050 [Klebsormidium nitens]
MAGPSTPSALDRHAPGLGLLVFVKATHFGELWAKNEFGDEWDSKQLAGTVTEYKHSRGKTPEKWGLLFEGDSQVYWFTKELLVEAGVPPRLLESDTGSAQAGGPGELDLRTPLSRGKSKVVDGNEEEVVRQPRKRAATRPSFRDDATDSDDEDESNSDEVDGTSESDSEGGAEGAAALPLGGRGRGRGRPPGKRNVVFQKRAAKKHGRQRVSKKLMDGASSGDEDGLSDEELAEEGVGPLDKEPEAAAGPSAEMSWEQVAEGDVLEDVQPPPFTGPASRVKNLPGLAMLTPLQVFLMLVPLSWWTFVVEQTNRYAAASRGEQGLPEGSGRSWSPVTLQELLSWFGLVFAMALHPLPALAHYWRTGVQGAVRFPGFGSFMSQKRFEQIKRYLHTNDNAQRPPDKATREHRLWHILPLLNLLEETFAKFYTPNQHVTFDERMIPLRNRGCPCRIYNPKKPHKFGVELFCAVDAETFYCFFQWVYDKIKVAGDGLHDMVVRKLGQRVPKDKGHVVILDRGFTGPLPLRALKEENLAATGTCLPNRKMFPKEMLQLNSKAERGTMKAAVCEEDGMVAVAWQDKKPVFFLSTCHGLSMGETGRRVAGTREEVPCPEIAFEYNKYKDAVDQFDKSCLGQNYSLEMEVVSRKWWVRVILGLLDGAMHNAYVLYHEAHPEVSRFDFMVTLQQQLVENTFDNLPGANKRGRSGGATTTTGSEEGHFLHRVKGASNRCRVCYAREGKSGTKNITKQITWSFASLVPVYSKPLPSLLQQQNNAMKYRSAFANLPEDLLTETRAAVQKVTEQSSSKKSRTWGELDDIDPDFADAALKLLEEVEEPLSKRPKEEPAPQSQIKNILSKLDVKNSASSASGNWMPKTPEEFVFPRVKTDQRGKEGYTQPVDEPSGDVMARDKLLPNFMARGTRRRPRGDSSDPGRDTEPVKQPVGADETQGEGEDDEAMAATFLSHLASFVLVLLRIYFATRSNAALCVPGEPYVDCNFHALSFPHWAALSGDSAALMTAWKAAVAQTPEYPSGSFAGQGLVITATKLDLVNVPVMLTMLRSQGFTLPVELWYPGEVTPDVMSSLLVSCNKLVINNVTEYAADEDLRSMVTSQGEHVFQVKPLAILHSAFEEVLFLDADNIPISDPAALFRSAQYLTTGALFWPDFWRTATGNPIWSILGVPAGGQELESGQILVNKRRAWGALNLAFFLAKDPPFQKLVNGDKEAFRLAFRATGTPFATVATPVAAAGAETDSGGFCGHTMVQHDPDGAPLFLHHNSLKHGAAVTWQLMKAVPAGNEFTAVPLPPAMINGEPVSCHDLTGADVIVTPEPFSAFEATFARLQAAVDPALKSASRDEFISVSLATARKLLQANDTTPEPTVFLLKSDMATQPPVLSTEAPASNLIITNAITVPGLPGEFQPSDPSQLLRTVNYLQSIPGSADFTARFSSPSPQTFGGVLQVPEAKEFTNDATVTIPFQLDAATAALCGPTCKAVCQVDDGAPEPCGGTKAVSEPGDLPDGYHRVTAAFYPAPEEPAAVAILSTFFTVGTVSPNLTRTQFWNTRGFTVRS